MDRIESIRHAARCMVRELHLLDGRDCVEDFSFSECHVLTELEARGRATASELSDLLVLEKSTVSRLVGNLVDKGLLTTTPDPRDRRVRRLGLTAAGRAGARRIHRYARGQVESALGYLPRGEARGIIEGLDRYAVALRHARLGQDFGFRPIRRRDNPAVAVIIRDVMTEFGAVGEGYSIEDPEVDDMHGAYPRPQARFWVIERDGVILGCGGYGPLQQAEEGVCELRKMYFRPELRGLGLGHRLLNRCLDGARGDGYSRCYLETLDSMEGAGSLYRRHGFRDLERPLGCTGHTACDVWMAKDLDD